LEQMRASGIETYCVPNAMEADPIMQPVLPVFGLIPAGMQPSQTLG
jgi:hypothetical protein